MTAQLPLTPRHREIIALIGKAQSNKQIGATLGISFKTVRCHVFRIMDRVGVRDRVSLALMHQRGEI